MLLSILVPARNEELNLENNKVFYDNLAKKGHQLIFINDNSTDETRKILDSDYSFAKVVHLNEDPPVGVVGKNNALIKGIEYVENEWILFLDCDIQIDNDEFIEKLDFSNKNIAYTLLPKFHNRTIIENFSLFFEQILAMNFNLFKSKSEVFGGFYLINQELYQKIGTHEKVKFEIVEDLAIGNLVSSCGEIVLIRDGNIQIFMYDNISDIIDGWSKNFSVGMKNIPWKRSILLISYIFILFFCLFKVPIIFYVSYILLLKLFEKQYVNTKFIFYWMWPLYLFFFVLIFLKSTFKVNQKWKGRKI